MNEETKAQISKSGWMCRNSYRGNCVQNCRHLLPHFKTPECDEFCHIEKVNVICIEVDSPEIRNFPGKPNKNCR